MNLSEIDFYRYFSFDLSIQSLTKYYPKSDINKSWSDIAKYMSEHGFDHRQYSGYLSVGKMNETQMIIAAMNMYKALPWLYNCADKFDSTAIIEDQTFDLNETYRRNVGKGVIIPVQKKLKTSNPPEENREDILLPKKEPGTRELLSEKSELTLTPEQFRALSEAGVGLKVIVDSKDLKKASKILEAANRPEQAGVHKLKR